MPGKKKKQPLSEKAKLAAFIECVASKNYAEANKYLVSIVDEKIKKQINANLNKPLF